MRRSNPGEASPERLARAQEAEQKALDSYVHETLGYLRGSPAESMRLDRAITEMFRQRNMGGYPPRTLEAWREKIRAEIERRSEEEQAAK